MFLRYPIDESIHELAQLVLSRSKYSVNVNFVII